MDYYRPPQQNNKLFDTCVPSILMEKWQLFYSKSNQRNYYANPATDEKLFEAVGCTPGSGWTVSEDPYYIGRLRQYRNVFSGEIRYDQVMGADFSQATTTPVTDIAKSVQVCSLHDYLFFYNRSCSGISKHLYLFHNLAGQIFIRYVTTHSDL